MRVGVTAARKAEEQVALLERRGASVLWAPALSLEPNHVDEASLRESTTDVLSRPLDLVLATTGIGMRTWFSYADTWGQADDLVAALGRAEIIARGPKSVGALRKRGLSEAWVAGSERFSEMLEHLSDRDLTGACIVVQEHGQSLSTAADRLRDRGADVTSVAIYRVVVAEDLKPLRSLVDRIAERMLDAVTFTSPPAVAALMQLANDEGRSSEVAEAFRSSVRAVCVGPVTAEACEVWDVPSTHPERSRLGAMVKHVESVLAP